MKGLRHYIKTLKNILRQHGIAQDDYYTYHYRPKRAGEVMNFMPESMPKVGIVIQGPLRKEDDFTVETVKLYKNFYPDSPIIVSTWDTESEADLEHIQSLCELCVSHFDKNEGNFQRTTSLTGIVKAQELGCEYVLKTRADQRVYAPRLLSFMVKMIADFPIRIKCAAIGRLICNGSGVFSDRLYNMSDQFVFGHSEDMYRFFACPIDERKTVDTNIPYIDHRQHEIAVSKLRIGEMWFTTHYLESLGFNLKWTHEDSDFYRNELFIVIDNAMMDFYWPKYSDEEYRWREYYERDSYHPVSFADWYVEQTKK